MSDLEDVKRDYSKLRKAVKQLYYSAVWSSDRLTPTVEKQMWTELKEAADFPDGNSPNRIKVSNSEGNL